MHGSGGGRLVLWTDAVNGKLFNTFWYSEVLQLMCQYAGEISTPRNKLRFSFLGHRSIKIILGNQFFGVCGFCEGDSNSNSKFCSVFIIMCFIFSSSDFKWLEANKYRFKSANYPKVKVFLLVSSSVTNWLSLPSHLFQLTVERVAIVQDASECSKQIQREREYGRGRQAQTWKGTKLNTAVKWIHL